MVRKWILIFSTNAQVARTSGIIYVAFETGVHLFKDERQAIERHCSDAHEVAF